MPHEFIDAVTITPSGPIEVSLGDGLPVTIQFSLNGPNPGGPTMSLYDLAWEETFPGAFSLINPAPVSPAVAGTAYPGTIPASLLPAVGTYRFRGRGYYLSDAAPPNNEQYAYSAELEVVVKRVRELPGAPDTATEAAAIAETATESGAPDESVSESSPPAASSTESGAPSESVTEQG